MPPVTLVSASFAVDHLQEDGRRWVTERFGLSAGPPVETRYLAAPNEDFEAHLTAMGEAVLAQLNRPAGPPEVTPNG